MHNRTGALHFDDFFGVFNVSPILAMGEKIGQKKMEVHSIRILERKNSTHI
jgi:hypothetical protein